MNTQLLEYIIAISEEKSLSGAAERLMITESALSQQVKKLEKELDARLFFRSKNQMLLTDAGRVYVHGARSLLSIYENTLTKIYQLKRSGKNQITLVCNLDILPDFYTEVLPEFVRLHPDIKLQVSHGNASVVKHYLLNGLADVGVLATGEMNHSLLEYIPLYTDELVLAVPETMGNREESLRSVLKRAGEVSFVLNTEGSHFRTLEREFFQIYQFTPQVLCEGEDMKMVRHMVMRQEGIGFLPKRISREDQGYRRISLGAQSEYRVVIGMHKSRELTTGIRALILLLLRTYEKLGEVDTE